MTTSKHTFFTGALGMYQGTMLSSSLSYVYRNIIWCNKFEYINVGGALRNAGIRIHRNTSAKYLSDIYDLLSNHISCDVEFQKLLYQIEYYTRSDNVFYGDRIESREEKRLKNMYSNSYDPHAFTDTWDSSFMTTGIKPTYSFANTSADYIVENIAWVHGNPYMAMDSVFRQYNIYLDDERERETDTIVNSIIDMLVLHVKNNTEFRDTLTKIAVDMELHGENGDPSGDLYRW